MKKDIRKTEKKPSMSFFTALSLSFTNLLTKKGRTFLTSFAGSIGIIGIALILALSNGIQTYIDKVQEDTLSSYPLSLQAEEMDLSSLLTSVSESKTATAHEKDAVYSSAAMYELINAMQNAETRTNNLGAFKAYLEAHMDEVDDLLNAVTYSYSVPIEAWAQTADGSYVRSDAGALVASMYGDMMGGVSGQYMSSSLNVWSEILTDKTGAGIAELVKEQYDVLYGAWPQAFNEIVIVVDSDNEITDLTLYTLGLKTAEEMKQITMQAMRGENLDTKVDRYSYEEICDLKLKLVLPTDYYVYNPAKDLYEDIRGNDSALDVIVGGGVDLKVCGILRRNPDATAGAIGGAIGYTAELTQYVIEGVRNSPVVKAQQTPENANRNVVTGLPFALSGAGAPDAAAQAAAFREYLGTLSAAEKAELYRKIVTTPSDLAVADAVEQYMKMYDTREKREALVLSSYGEQAGMDEEMIASYLAGMSDAELETVLRRAMDQMYRATYAAEAEKKIEEIISTPSEEELAALREAIGGRLSVRAAKAAFVSSQYAASGLPAALAAEYLGGLSDEEFEKVYAATLDKVARATYESTFLPSLGQDGRNAKLAAALDALTSPMGEGDLAALYGKYMPSAVSDVSLEDLLGGMGLCDPAVPSAIRLYPVDFDAKEQLADFIGRYNDAADEEDVIDYTDYVALLMSSITTIIDVISYVLIAFVAISLVVSSIMIGIITYISVLERTKEIGILRAMGASKRDVSRVFNAETLMIGFGSGVIGIGVTLLLCLPINAIIRALSGIHNIGAALPPLAGVILVGISMGLTLLAGLVPASIAARKDPVEALRSE